MEQTYFHHELVVDLERPRFANLVDAERVDSRHDHQWRAQEALYVCDVGPLEQHSLVHKCIKTVSEDRPKKLGLLFSQALAGLVVLDGEERDLGDAGIVHESPHFAPTRKKRRRQGEAVVQHQLKGVELSSAVVHKELLARQNFGICNACISLSIVGREALHICRLRLQHILGSCGRLRARRSKIEEIGDRQQHRPCLPHLLFRIVRHKHLDRVQPREHDAQRPMKEP
mmetsp:Transcript_18800/g.71159  ORF Transcript_18800/g.71159 Transcript_18800/m.71159 type:complete len:228 (+) Transcript_18800:850-1533(+)